MENEKRKMDNENRQNSGEKLSVINYSLSVCSACGSDARRSDAKFCLVCGKLLGEDYQPLDTLRASYRMQGKDFEFQSAQTPEVKDLFEQNKNSVSQTAWACLVYSFVPYLGILFVPFTIFIGGFGYAKALRQPQIGGRKLALVCVILSFVVLAIQIFLWWLLYIVPELGRRI